MPRALAYFDESGTDAKSTILCVAGYIFLEENAVAFEVEWKKMLEKYGIPFFHMVDCAHGTGYFKALSPVHRIEIQKEAIALTKRYASKGIALSIEKSAFPDVGPLKLWSTPYTFLCGQVLYGVQLWADEAGFEGEIEYVFEAGADGEKKSVAETTNALLSSDDTRKLFRYSKHTHATKTEAVQLQCADLLAWHWFTHQRRTQEGKGKRADFKNLIGLRIDPHHYDKERIAKWQIIWDASMKAATRLQPTHCSAQVVRDLVKTKYL
jgi:hypothetical protein